MNKRNVNEITASQEVELSLDELDAVAGGNVVPGYDGAPMPLAASLKQWIRALTGDANGEGGIFDFGRAG